MTECDSSDVEAPFWCPWCEALIVIDGDLATSEAEAYWHAYDHKEKGPYAVTVMEAFEPLPAVETVVESAEVDDV